MLSFKGEIKDVVKTFNGEYIFTIATKRRDLLEDEINTLKSAKKGLKIDISHWRDKRSLDSNAYLWVLLDKIAGKLNQNKEEIYRHFVKDYGVFEILPIKDNVVESFIYKWKQNGIGYICESLGKSKLENYTNIIAYFGSSVYDSKEMTRLLNAVVEQAKELGIQTLDEIELKQMAEEWEKKQIKK